jgi:hypothetical protein
MGDNDNLQWHFDGEITNLLLLDRPLEEIELLFLAESGGDIAALNALYANSPSVDDNESETGDQEQDEPSDDTGPDDEAPTGETGDTGVQPVEEEESGFAAIFSKILNIFLSIFGLGRKGNDNAASLDDQLAEVETLLNDLVPMAPSVQDDEMTLEDEEEDPVMEML